MSIEQQAHIEELTELRRLVPSVNQRAALDAAIAALAPKPQAHGLPPLPIAFFDEFGAGADDRVQDYARAALASQPPAPAAAVPDRRAEAWQAAFDHAVSVHRRNKSKSWLLECLRDDYEHRLAAAPAPEAKP